MVGYVLNRYGHCYRICKPRTNYIYESRDIIWFQIKYFPKKSVTPEQNKVPLVRLHIDKVTDNDIIEVREGNYDSTSADSSN